MTHQPDEHEQAERAHEATREEAEETQDRREKWINDIYPNAADMIANSTTAIDLLVDQALDSNLLRDLFVVSTAAPDEAGMMLVAILDTYGRNMKDRLLEGDHEEPDDILQDFQDTQVQPDDQDDALKNLLSFAKTAGQGK